MNYQQSLDTIASFMQGNEVSESSLKEALKSHPKILDNLLNVYVTEDNPYRMPETARKGIEAMVALRQGKNVFST